MKQNRRPMVFTFAKFACCIALLSLTACAKAYYGAMEKVGYHKRDILVDRVEDAKAAQTDAQEQFSSALEQFGAVIQLEQTELKTAYETLNGEYEDSVDAAEAVSDKIAKVEDVAEALFAEWEKELDLYSRESLKIASRQKLADTRAKYKDMVASMHRAEKSMAPVLQMFQDNVLFLKHNLNAQAIGTLKTEFASLKSEINGLIANMNDAIARSNRFITEMQQ